ncbi:hypothetical protein H4R23_005753, partial [Coemansia sp. Cherry 401B]
SEPGALPPARRLRTTPSASDLRTQATPQARQRRVVGGSLGRAAYTTSTTTTRPAPRRPLPSPLASQASQAPQISQVSQVSQVSHIPRPALQPELDSREPHTFIMDTYQERTRQLSLERQTNRQLLAEVKNMHSYVVARELELKHAEAQAADALARANAAESECLRLTKEKRALEDYYAAQANVVRTQAAALARTGDASSDPADCSDWPATCARVASLIGAGRGADEGLASPKAKPSLFTPRQRRQAQAQEARADRRRSTMLFDGLIRPSAAGPEAAACERCDQLLESLQTVQLDNDYYREANARLRDSLSDTVSRHNAMVRVFERERTRRRERRAQELADASHVAARDRAQLNAQHRAELGIVDADDLARRFDRAVHIA